MFEQEVFQLPKEREKPIMFYTNDDLLRAYKLILMDTDSAGVHEPVAQGIRELWQRRGLNKAVLNRLEKNFKNLRKISKKSLT